MRISHRVALLPFIGSCLHPAGAAAPPIPPSAQVPTLATSEAPPAPAPSTTPTKATAPAPLPPSGSTAR
jgi:hypothetical protein